MSVDEVSKNIKVDNNDMGNYVRNQDNWYAIVKNTEDFDNGATIMVNPIDRVFTDVLVYLFDLLSS